jgi:23S rRNA (adenine1618-N6)-methyltransferase
LFFEVQKMNKKMHPRNQHKENYNFPELIQAVPELGAFVKMNAYGNESIDFFNAEAVKLLNKALLKSNYGIAHWDIPANYLCPPIPGRAEYMHQVADLLYKNNPEYLQDKKLGNNIRVLDVGVGANCIYPIVGVHDYNWNFVGTDIDEKAIAASQKIVNENESLQHKIELRHQKNAHDIFHGIILPNEKFHLTVCNPPFHASLQEAQQGNLRKNRNLKNTRNTKVQLNFGGQGTELWCEGGEETFIEKMILQSAAYSNQVLWFSTLVSKESTLKKIQLKLEYVDAREMKILPMQLGNKVSRIVAWSFHSELRNGKIGDFIPTA